MKILIIDDVESTALLVAELVSLGGWSPVCCNPSENLASRARQENAQAFLIDFGMPEKNGVEVASELRLNGVTSPIVLYSDTFDGIDDDEVARLGILQILQKPLRLKDLRGALAEVAKMIVAA